ncbi:MAG: L-seryl-tRNA(Sec) selenium transferase [Dehalococcoidia bacterium]
MPADEFRKLPSVDAVLSAIGNGRPHTIVLEAVRAEIAGARERVRAGEPAPSAEDLAVAAATRADHSLEPSLRPVINATGVILQTNLGRAPLSLKAIAAMDAVARGYSNLEFGLEAGARGSRHEHVRDLLRRTTGAEDGLVVNNNAAALFMVLQVFAAGREVIVSRGQAVEIGGGFRIPDVLRQSGARVVEVGTTNRTYTRDYADAVSGETAGLLRVHTSNFRVVGFTAEAPLAELSALARERGLLLLDDLGSGCLVATERYGLDHEPTVQESLAAGADLALFSGDKLLGGPQCGIITGRGALIEELRRHPLARALRVDKLTIAALNATLMSYLTGSQDEEIPVWRMVSARPAGIRRRARAWARAAGPAATVVSSRSMVGGGSLPGESLPTWCVAIRPASGAEAFAHRLRTGTRPLVARIEEGAVLLDPRTVDPVDDAAVARILAESSP